jgi:amidase
VATADDVLVQRLRAAGMVVLGLTHLPELALWAATESRHHGVTRNPWDTSLAPGGSSGGTAAAVAAGLVPAGHATDGLGSIRIPASSCGLVGLKPTHGLVPLGPDPDHWQGLSHAGFLTRTTRDTALLLDAVVDPSPGFTEALDGPATLRIAASTKTISPTKVDDRVRQVFLSALETIRGLGHTVVDRDPPYGAAVANANTVRYLSGVATDVSRLADPRATEARTRTLARMGRILPGRALGWARRRGHRLRTEMAEQFFADIDVLVTPTVPMLPVRAGSVADRSLAATLGPMLPRAAYTSPWNACGLPALSAPVGITDDGLPVGVQLVGPPGSDGLLLRLAQQLETATGWATRRPPL